MIKSKLYWKIMKFINPELVENRNKYIRYNANCAIYMRIQVGEAIFNKYWGKDYISNMEKDIV